MFFFFINNLNYISIEVSLWIDTTIVYIFKFRTIWNFLFIIRNCFEKILYQIRSSINKKKKKFNFFVKILKFILYNILNL